MSKGATRLGFKRRKTKFANSKLVSQGLQPRREMEGQEILREISAVNTN